MNRMDSRKGTTMAKTTNILWLCALVSAVACVAAAQGTRTEIWSGELNIPNLGPFVSGEVTQYVEFAGLPAGATVTEIDCSVLVDDRGDPDSFWCSDYEIYIGNESRGAFYHRVWDNQGEETDNGHDNDPENDSDVDLTRSLPTEFDGDKVNQRWYVGIRDNVSSHWGSFGGFPLDKGPGIGRLERFRVTVFYEASRPDLRDAGEAYRTVSSTTLGWLDPFKVSCRVRNSGDSAAGAFSVHFYVSTDTNINILDTFVGGQDFDGLAAGQSADASESGTFPNLSPGTYYLGWIIDPTNRVAESNEGNNTAYMQITVVEKVPVPNVVGMTQSQAASMITSAGLSVGTIGHSYSDTVPEGRVISQNPTAGAQVNPGSAVALIVSQGPGGGPPIVAVPDVVGMSQPEATAAITAAGLSVGTITNEQSDTVPPGQVISQDPLGETQAANGSAVNLIVSSDPALADPTPDGPAGHWRLDETQGTTAFDSVGAHDGTLRGNPNWLPDGGMIDGALRLDGIDDAVSIPKVGETAEFTYSLWLNQTVIRPGYIGLIDHKDWVRGSVHFELRDGHPKVGINGAISPGGDLEGMAYTLAAGEWHHVALTKSATSLDLYADGELAAQRALATSDAVILGDGFIGSWRDAQGRLSRCFSGTLDDVRVYTRALNASQVQKVMMDSDGIILTGVQDIGATMAGSDSYSGGVYAVMGGGTDIWDRRDAFRYVYRPVTGDFEISARVLSLENTNPWAKAGVMVRETLSPESRHAFMCVTPQEGEGRFALQCRPTAAGLSTSRHSVRGQVSYPTNTWVRIKRQGNSFMAQTSQDGVVWTNFAGPEVDLQGYPSATNPVTIDMPETVYIGLAVTAHSAGQLATAEFDNILISLHPGEGPEGLLALWGFDETSGGVAADSVGARDGVLMGNPNWQPTGGKVGGALRFAGSSDYVVTDMVLNPADGPFSVFAWVKGGAPTQVIVSQADGAVWLAAGAGGTLRTQISGSRTTPLTSSTVITNGAWHRVGFVWNGSNRILYVDGVEVARDTQNNLAGSEAGLYIGAGPNLAPTSFWSGIIDDVRVYNRAVVP